MADSDNTTTLPFVTCGRKTRNVVDAGGQTSERMGEKGNDAGADPALVLSQAWMEAYARTLALCLRQQQLETELVLGEGFPSTIMVLPKSGDHVVSRSEDLEHAFGAKSGEETGQNKVAEASAAHWARWHAKDAELRYSVTKEAEQQAADKEQLLLDELAATPARTTEGAIAKLAVVLRDVEDNRDASDFPFCSCVPSWRISRASRIATHLTDPSLHPMLARWAIGEMPVADCGTSGGKNGKQASSQQSGSRQASYPRQHTSGNTGRGFCWAADG